MTLRTEGSPDLVTGDQALGICAQAGYPLAASTWRAKVGEGVAPPVAHRRGRTPLWRRADVQQWAQEVAGHRAAIGPVVEPTQPGRGLLLRSELHGVTLDPLAPRLLAIDDARGRLAARRDDLDEAVARLERYTTAAVDHDSAPGEERRHGLAAVLARLWSGTPGLVHHDSSRRTQVELRDASDARQAAIEDLAVIEDYVDGVLQWAARETHRRQVAAEQTDLADEEVARVDRMEDLVQRRYGSPTEFVLEDPGRLAWAHTVGQSDGIGKSEVIERVRESPDGHGLRLVLGGIDLMYNWRLDGTDLGSQGRWRVSSLFDSTGEIYAEHQDTGWVLVVATLPTSAPMAVVAQLRDIEARRRERNSLVLMAEAVHDLASRLTTEQ